MAKQIYTNKVILDVLGKIPFFSMFSEDEIRRMLYSGELVRIIKFSAEDRIIREGTYGSWVYVLLKGRLRVEKNGAEVAKLTNQGDIIGEIAALTAGPRSASVTAADDAILLAVNVTVIKKMSGIDANNYLTRLKDFFAPLIEERLSRTFEVEEILRQIRQKETEIAQLRTRLKKLGASEEKDILAMILDNAE